MIDWIKKWIAFLGIFKYYILTVVFVIAIWILYYFVSYQVAVSNLPEWFKYVLLK